VDFEIYSSVLAKRYNQDKKKAHLQDGAHKSTRPRQKREPAEVLQCIYPLL